MEHAKIEGYDDSEYSDQYYKAVTKLEADGIKKPGPYMVAAEMRRIFPGVYTDSATGKPVGRPKGSGKHAGRAGGDGTVDLKIYDRFRDRIASVYTERERKRGFKLPPSEPASLPRKWDIDGVIFNAKAFNHALYSERVGPEIKGGHLHGYGWIASRPTLPEGWTEEDVVKAAEHVLRTAWSDGVFGDVTATFRGVSVIVHVKRRKSGYRVASIFPEA